MSHDTEFADHEIEHMAVELLTLAEQDLDSVEDLRRATRSGNMKAVLDRVVHRGLARVEEDRILLTDKGRDLAEWQLRRHRLAEVLFQTVLEVGDSKTAHHTACVMEHIISPAVTDSVCAFLGHPKFCPHGKPIPPGSCCRTFSNAIEPLVQPLEQLAVGQSARVVYMVPKDPARMVKLSNLGLAPGATVRLQQKRPATVLAMGETTLALDHDIASEIYVKPLN